MICKKCGKMFNGMEELCPKCRKGSHAVGNFKESFFSGFNSKKVALGTAVVLGQPILGSVLAIGVAYKMFGNDNLRDPQTGCIKEEVKNKFRENFNIDIDEEIVFVRDTSLLKSRDRGVAITDKRIYYCIDNNGPYCFRLDAIRYVEYKDLNFIFSFDNNESLTLHVKHFMDWDNSRNVIDMAKSFATELMDMVKRADVTTDRYNEICVEYNKLIKDGNLEDALKVAINASRNEGFVCFYYHAAQCASMLEKDELVITLCDEGLSYCENNSELMPFLFAAKYDALDCLEMPRKEVRKNCLPVVLNATDDMRYYDENLKKCAQSDFEEYDNDYAKEFLQQSYSERKLLVPVKQYTDLMQNELSVIDIQKLSLTGIDFPIGHPKPYQLYIGHPSLKSKYIPFEDYELEFVKDKLREFCYFAQCLGATEIHIGFEVGSSNDKKRHEESTVSGELGKEGFGKIGASYQNDRTRRVVEEISNSMELHQHILATNICPHLPDDLVWYPSESSWQKLYKQRMGAKNGLSHTEKIQTSKSRVLDSAELTAVKGEFESIYVSGKGAWDKRKDESFSISENVTLTINVTFAPISEQENNLPKSPEISSYTDVEFEYIGEVKACLEDDGTITPSERRLLDKLRKRLGISAERAIQLEANLTPQLTKEEKEYVEDVKSCIEEDGRSVSQLSKSERRLLEKSRIRLNISEKRAKELEKGM